MSSPETVDEERVPILQWALRIALQGILWIVLGAIRILPRKTGGVDATSSGRTVLVTGQFYSLSWLSAHITPLANCAAIRKIIVVSSMPWDLGPKVQVAVPARGWSRLLGATFSRLVTFSWIGIRERPDLVGGFHLLFNGIAAAMVARLAGGKSIYFCVGGPTETLYGSTGENRLFRKLRKPHASLTALLLRIVAQQDFVVTMGSGARDYFVNRIAGPEFVINPGGINDKRFGVSSVNKSTDLLLVARLSPVKQVEVFIDAIALLIRNRPDINAAIAGDGPEMPFLLKRAKSKGLARNLKFLGHRDDIDNLLREAKLFVLVSRSEGVALAVMEALVSGVPVIVPAVGDLSDIVKDNENGFLVKSMNAIKVSRKIEELLDNEEKLAIFSKSARESGVNLTTEAATERWDRLLSRPDIA